MKGYRMNPDREYANKIIEGIYKKDGHCTCKVKADETTLCPCDDFINTKFCTCRLFVKEEKED